MNPVLVAAGVLLFGICAFDIMGVLVRMLGGALSDPTDRCASQPVRGGAGAVFALARTTVVQIGYFNQPEGLACNFYPVIIGRNGPVLFL